MKITYLAALSGILLSGCQMQQTHTALVTTQTTLADALLIKNTQQHLYFAGVLNQPPSRLLTRFTANSDRVSLDWDGDAIELLAQLARQRGLNFAYSGVRLPLPVIIHVRNVTLENLLHQLEIQVGWRATIKQQPLELHLYFTLPEKEGRQT